MTEILQNKEDLATQVLATVEDHPIALVKNKQVAWVRGSNCTDMSAKPMLPLVDDPTQYFHADVLLRHALCELGLHVGFTRFDLSHRNPVMAISRHANALWFSGYAKDSTTQWELALPEAGGMPVMVQCDALLRDGKAIYHTPRAWRHECRVLVQQQNGVVGCSEHVSFHDTVKRRLLVTGLKNAVMTFLPEPGFEENTTFQIDAPWPYINGQYQALKHSANDLGKIITAQNITGNLLISW